MSRLKLSLPYLVREPGACLSGQPPLLLMLHGVGSNEADLMGLAPLLDRRFFIVSVRAPITLRPGAYAWSHATFTADGPVEDAGEIDESRGRLVRFLGELERAHGYDHGAVYLLGFSQGAAMAADLALSRRRETVGLVMMSGRILPQDLPCEAPERCLDGLPVCVAHGSQDIVVPVAYGRQIRDTLESLGADVTYREYPMEHEMTADSLEDVAAWLRTRLDAASG